MDHKYPLNEDPEAALAALKLYEETASAEREAHMSLLQGREPPSVDSTTQPVVLPSAFKSLLLPTDPEAIDYPEKTLESVSATCGFVTETCNELRWKDTQYCANYFPGRVVLSPRDVVLARMGSSALVDKLAELQQVACINLDQNFKKGVLANVIKKSETSSKPDEQWIYGRYLACSPCG
ncbi:hypothetical protein B0H14DRAFT_2825284, partial [Mycena olivaceomarginata]